MNVIRTNIKIDAGKLLEIYQHLQTKYEERVIDSDIAQDMNDPNYCFPGGQVHGMRFQGTKTLTSDTENIPSNSKEGSSLNHLFTERNEKCIGYLNDVLDFFVDGLRGSFWTMDPGFCYKPHIDRPENIFRIHIALTTNPFCHMTYENGESYHIPVDGYAWLTRVAMRHTAWNMGDTPRTHIPIRFPMSAWDRYASHPEYTI